MLLSIVIPTYNRADYIGKTIASLLHQDVADADFEIIVVDDGSTDNTDEVVGAHKDPRLQYVKKSNAERAAARNHGARLAKGAYVNFFDSDDVAYPNHIRSAVESIRRLGSPEVFHLGYDVKDADGGLMRVADTWPARINDLLIDGNHLSCNGVFMRTDICQQYPFNENRGLSASEDYELWLRLAARFDFHCVSVVTSTVVNHEARSVLKINEEKFLLRMQLLQHSLTEDDRFVAVYGGRLNTFRAYLNIYMALHLAMAGLPKAKSLHYLSVAVKHRPGVVFSRRFAAALKNVIL